MEHKLTITLPEDVFRPLIETAQSEGVSPEQVITRLIKAGTSCGAKPQDSLRELFGSIDMGYAMGADNESIDRDLAREYGATHDVDVVGEVK